LPLTLVTRGLEVVRVPVPIVAVAGDPTFVATPLEVRAGSPTTLRAIVTGSIELTGESLVTSDVEGVDVVDYRVLSDSEAEVDVLAARGTEGTAWISLTEAGQTVRALIYVLEGVPRIEDHVRLRHGQPAGAIAWDAPLASFAPGDTLARVAPRTARVRVLAASATGPEQINLEIEALAPGGSGAASVLLVTGDEVVSGSLDLRADGAVALPIGGAAVGDAVPGSPALFVADLEGTPWLGGFVADGPAQVEILSADGAAVLEGPGPAGAIRASEVGPPFLRVSASDEVGGAFEMRAADLARDAAEEFEPNGTTLTAEVAGDPSVRPELLVLSLGGADVDMVRATSTIPAAIEVLGASVGPAWWAAHTWIEPVDADGAGIGAGAQGPDPHLAIDPGETMTFALGAVRGSAGPVLVAVRSRLIVSEVAPTADARAFVEIRGVSSEPLDGWSLELVDGAGKDLGVVDLSGAEIGADPLFVIGGAAGAGVDLAAAAVRSLGRGGGTVRVLWEGGVVDEIEWGDGVPSPPIGGSLVRPHGIDRDDERDWEIAQVPTVGTPNR
jgi:hypothetical protein